jgi:hypothetical protein
MGGQFSQYTDTIIPLIIESVVLGALVNLVSDYIGSRIAMDGVTVFILLFLLLAFLLLYALFQGQVRDRDFTLQKPTEFGSLLSLVFFIQLLFFDCTKVSEFSKWFLVGAGVVPFFLGTGLTGILETKWRKFKDDLSKKSPTPNLKAEPPAGVSTGSEDEDGQTTRISIHSVLDGVADIERQPGILIVIIESILSVKKMVTQLEIFEVCRILSKELPSAKFIELIRDFMAKFVNIRQSTRKVSLHTENASDWKIIEHPGITWLD